MRYYGSDYLDDLKRSINNVSEAADLSYYPTPIRNAQADGKSYAYKMRGIDIAQNAYDHVARVNNKLIELQGVLETFYGEVDSISNNVFTMARMICMLIDESNRSMSNICDMLDGVGKYKGTEVTSGDIKAAGIDREKCKNLKNRFWTFIIDAEVDIDGGILDQGAVTAFLDDIAQRKMEAKDLPLMDYNRLKKLYHYYVKNRYGEEKDISKTDYDTCSNCVRVFELLNPLAKTATDKFFKDVIKDEAVFSIMKMDVIKYAIYTQEPKLRSITLYYLSKVKLADYEAANPHYNDFDNNIYIDLSGFTSDSSEFFNGFFHEFGHALDDYSNAFGMSSKVIHDQLIEDFKDHMDSVIKQSNYSLSKDEIKALFDFVISNKNINVKPMGKEKDHYLPADWSQEQKDVFFYLRDYYGYREYIYGRGTKYFDISVPHHSVGGFSYEQESNRVVDDIVGGITNNQFGGVFGHPRRDIPTDISSEEDLIKCLQGYTYWYEGKTSDTIKEKLEAEFFATIFAQSFNGDVHSQAEKIFGKSCSIYDGIIDKIYDDVPDKYKEFDD